MAGLEAYVAGVPGGLGAFANDPMGDATAAIESRRRAQVEGARAPAWMRDIGANIGNLADQTVSSFIPPALRDRLPSAEMIGNLVVGALPGSGDYMAARDALESSAASLSALGRGDYMGAGARGVDALAAGLGIMPFLPYLASIKGVRKPIRAYHGSPHDFDKFDMSKIGTGEGAQAYGHGLYFAENEGVARSYRDALTAENSFKYKGATPRQLQMSPEPEDYAALSVLLKLSRDNPNIAAARKSAERKLRQNLRAYQDEAAGGSTYAAGGVNRTKAEIQAIRSFRDEDFALPDPGRMYEVNIHADPKRFLDWDKPLGDQSEQVRRALGWTPAAEKSYRSAQSADTDALLNALLGDARYVETRPPVPKGLPPLSATGGDILKGGSVFDRASDPAKSAALRDAGIPGIKYLDQGSRAAGDGSRNYVVFDDKLIEILRKYGIMAPVTGLGALVASGQDDPNL